MELGMDVKAAEGKEGLFNRNFTLLLCGQIISFLGTAVHVTAVVWYIMSAFPAGQAGKMVAAFSICTLLPMLIAGPLGGVLADRWNRVHIIAGTDIIAGVLFVLLTAMTYLNIAPMASLYGITVLASAAGSLCNPSIEASMPNMVGEKHLLKANSLNGASRQLSYVIGAAAAGFLYHWAGIEGVFLINGVSFLLAGLAEMCIRLPRQEKSGNGAKGNGGKRYFQEFGEGIRYFRKDKLVMTMMICAVILNFIFAPMFEVVFPRVMKFDLGLSVQQYGVMNSIFSVGGILGMLMLSIVAVKNRYKTVTVSMFGMVAAFTLFGVPLMPGIAGRMGTAMIYVVFGALALGLMITNSFVNIPIMTAMQTRVPDEYRARFFSILMTFCMMSAPLGSALAGVLVDSVPAMALFFGGGAVCLIVCVWLLFKPAMREL